MLWFFLYRDDRLVNKGHSVKTQARRTLPAKKTIFIQSSIDSYSEGLIDEWSWKPSEKNFTYYSDEYKMIIRYHFA